MNLYWIWIFDLVISFTLKKLECLNWIHVLNTLAWDNEIEFGKISLAHHSNVTIDRNS